MASSGGYGVHGAGGNLTVTGCRVSGSHTGISVSSNDSINVNRNTVLSNSGGGVVVGPANGKIALRENTSNNNRSGFYFFPVVPTRSFTNNTACNNRDTDLVCGGSEIVAGGGNIADDVTNCSTTLVGVNSCS